MAHKDITNEEVFNILDPSLSEFISLDESDDSNQLFDEIVTVDERYSQNSIVNQGGMKKIYRTMDSLTNRPVAKATLINCEDPVKAESFLREARLTAALEHPNIMPVYDIGVDETEGPYFIMKLIGGQSLGDILKNMSKETAGESAATPGNTEKYSLTDLMTIFLKVCDAVAYAHSKGVIHLDLKPGNIQVGDYGEVLVCDWGLAKVLEEIENVTESTADLDPMLYNDLTLDGIIKGTPGYMAPEQIDTELGPKNRQTDIYALGGILYSLLCLKAPYESETLEGVIKETLIGGLQSPSERDKVRSIPPSLEAVAMKALEVTPEKRYQNVNELWQEINKWLGGFATDAENAGFIKSAWLLINRHKAVSSLLVLLLISAAFAFYKINKNENRALVNEQKAIQNEQKATTALQKLKDERRFRLLVSDNAISQLKISYNKFLENREFSEALKFISDSVELHPDNELLNTYKGELHFYMMDYSQAINAFEKSGSFKNKEPYKTMFKLAPEYEMLARDSAFIPAADLVELAHSFSKEYRTRAVAYIFERISSIEKYKLLFSDPGKRPLIDQHMEFCRLMTLRDALNLKNPLQLNFNYTLQEDGISLDLSNSRFDRLYYLRHLPLKSLNFENSSIWRKWVFSHYSLKTINIKNTNIKNISREDVTHNLLNEIILTKDQYLKNNLDEVKGLRKRLKFITD